MTQGSGGGSSRLAAALGVHPDETRMVVLVTVVFFGTQSTHALSANTADTLFFTRFGVEFLPQMYISLGVLTMAALLGYAGVLGGVRRVVFYPGLLATAGIVTIALWLLVQLDQRWVYAVLWLTLNILMVATLTFMWTLAGEVTDARSSKRLYPLFASAGILGGVVGSLAIGPLVRLIGIENVLVVIAGILAATAVVAARVGGRYARVTLSGAGPIAAIRGGFRDTMDSPLLRLLGVAMLLSSALFVSVAFPFSTAVSDGFDSEAEIASFLGLFSAAATTVTFLVSMFIANRIFARIGIVMAIMLVAVVYLAGFTLWLASFTLLTASLFRFVQWVAVNAVGATSQTAVFNVLRSERRARALAFSSAGPLQVGVIVGGVLLLLGQQLSGRQVFSIGFALAAGYTFVAWRMRSHYTEALVAALRSGRFEVFTTSQVGLAKPAADADALSVAVAGLGDEQPIARRTAAQMLGRLGGETVVEPLLDALQDPEIAVRLAALDALEMVADDPFTADVVDPNDVVAVLTSKIGLAAELDSADPEEKCSAAAWLVRAEEFDAAGALLSDLLDSPAPAVREAATVAVRDTGWCPDPARLAEMVRCDPSRRVRVAAVRAIGAVSGPDQQLLDMFVDDEPTVRLAAGAAWRDCDGDPGPMLDLLLKGPQWSSEAAILGLDRRAGEVQEEVVAWATTRIERLVEVGRQRASIAAYGTDGTMPALEYLGFLLGELAWAHDRVAVRVLGLLEPDETVELILDGVRSSDVDSRAQALEALDSVGGSLGRAVVPLVEGSDRYEGMEVREALRSLVSHPDRGVRMMALLSVRDLVEREWRPVVESASTDPDDAVASIALDVLARMGVVHETLGTMGQMERVLALRQVPIFATLWPDVLEHLAETATERIFESGDVIFSPGDPGDELVVIVAGNAEVTFPDGRPFMRLGPGDYTGEMTLLQRSPRVGSLRAQDDVRLLAIGESALDALLEERPEVGRAMLANLATRMADAVSALATHDAGDSATSQ